LIIKDLRNDFQSETATPIQQNAQPTEPATIAIVYPVDKIFSPFL